MVKINKSSNYFFLFGVIFTGLISVISVPTLTWFYEVRDIGIYTVYLISFAFLVTISSLAMEQSFLREYYNVDNKFNLFVSCFGIVIVVFTISSTSIYFFRQSISRFLFGEEYYLGLIAFCSAAFITLFSSYLNIALRMNKQAFYYSISQILQVTIAFACSVSAYFYFDTKVTWKILIWSHMLGLLTSMLFCLLILMYNKNVIPLFLANYKEKLNTLTYIRYSLPLLMSTFVLWVLGSTDKYVLKILTNLEELGLYANAYKVAGALVLLQKMISGFA